MSMRVLWPHNFDPKIPLAGVFMFVTERALVEAGLAPELIYLGNLRSPLQILRARQAASRAARDTDLLHCQFGSAAALACATAGDCPRIVSLRGSDWTPRYSDRLTGRLHAGAAALFTRLSLPRYDAVICVSERISREVAADYPSLTTYVLPSPIDLRVFVPLDQADARNRLDLPDAGERYVVFGSALSRNPLKRRWLAEATLKWVQSRMPEVRMLVATGYPHSMMPTVLSAADVAICTSTSEGWPNFIKEALACNVPFVSTDVSDLAEIAAVEPSCRVVAPTPEALGQALLEVLESPRPNDLARHVAGMSTQAHAAKLLQIYREVLAHR